MIFDIYGKETDGRLVFDIPYYRFNQNDSIAVTRLMIKWKSEDEHIVAVVETDLISNYRRQILTFSKQSGTFITDIFINFPIFYSVYEDNLEKSTFFISPLFQESLPEIDYLYIQLIKK